MTAESQSTVFVVDDDQDIRRATCRLAQAEGLAAQGFASAAQFLHDYDPKQPGCIVLDIRMPGMSGVELQKALSAGGPCSPIIFVSAHGDIRLAMQVVRDGAFDFIPKPFCPQALMERIRHALALDRENRRMQALAAEAHERFSKLTNREREISFRLAAGETPKHIAQHL